ncbi:RNA polymerase sigma factor [Rathayibacter soli]|uniref:RNA polymerase sigma factor n=1 Tax=Rathayibacter soli TaxID=3144168 RepID=UPI0027E4BB82|nr:sigma-70 family RNA polymerase sigma factor [Glaciibacter superstes]
MENHADGVLERDDAAPDSELDDAYLSVEESIAGDLVDPAYDWVGRLTGPQPARNEAIRRLHTLMIRAARFKLSRMGEAPRLGRARAEVIVQSSADEAVVAILARLGTFEGRSRFTTWAYKFAILHTATAVRRELWSRVELDLSSVPEPVTRLGDPLEHVEGSALADALRTCIARSLTPHQQRILIAIVVEGVPIDVVAERLNTTRNTVYKTLHDARKRLREGLIAQGYLDPSRGRPDSSLGGPDSSLGGPDSSLGRGVKQ